jgi:hypothetical protein
MHSKTCSCHRTLFFFPCDNVMTENTTKSPSFHASRLIVGLLFGMGVVVFEGCTYEEAPPSLPCGDNSGVSFAGDLLPLLDVHCNGCHSGGSPSAGLNLENHISVSQSVLEGSLIERLKLPQTNIQMMPLSGSPLPECDIALFEVWASEGAPNN